MLMHAMLALALSAAPPQVAGADTVITVNRDTRLEVENHRGEVLIDAWDRDGVRVQADLDRDQMIDAARSGTVLRVRPRTARGGLADADLRVTVPRWMSIRVEGNQLDVAVRGTEGELSVQTVNGDIEVEGGAGLVTLRSIQGQVTVRGASGRVEAITVNEDIEVSDIDGEVDIETTNGDVTLRRIRATTARATTVNGDVFYDGSIRDGGRYAFSTHNGDISVTVAENANTTVSVSTYRGDFESDFPVRLTGATRDRQFTFTLGSGSARLELESFNGEIRLRRP